MPASYFKKMSVEGYLNPSQEMAQEPILGMEEGSLDDRGRVRVSSKVAQRLGRNFVLFLDPVGCIAAYPLKIWKQKLHEILSRPASEIQRSIELRDLGAMAEDDNNADVQGRFVIPKRFRAALASEKVALVGAVDRLEIWEQADHSKFVNAKKQQAKTLREMAEKG